jgi:hypothetical protein
MAFCVSPSHRTRGRFGVGKAHVADWFLFDRDAAFPSRGGNGGILGLRGIIAGNDLTPNAREENFQNQLEIPRTDRSRRS